MVHASSRRRCPCETRLDYVYGSDGTARVGLTRLRPGGGRIETASRRHRPPPVKSIDLNCILNRSILFRLDEFPNLSSQILSNVAKIFPKPSKIEPKWIQKVSWIPSWTHACKKLPLNDQKTTKRHPRASERRLRARQNLPK